MEMVPFIRRLLEAEQFEADIAVGILWLKHKSDPAPISANDIKKIIHEAGGATINATRLKEKLKGDPRVATRSGDRFEINVRRLQNLDEHFSEFSGPMRPKNSGSVLDANMFAHARKYVQNISWQINASYDHGLFDCCAVMCRRLFETLIIDAFDHQKQLALVTDGKGEILRLSALIGVLKNQTAFRVGRQVKEAADKLKNIGDWSAHSRTFIARQGHIDKIADDLSVSAMELLHLAGQD
jgi:hypothetical protein